MGHTILNKFCEVAYHLYLPLHSRVHTIFHVSWQKYATTDPTPFQKLTSFLSEELEMQVQPETLVKYLTLLNGSQEVFIRWKELPDSENTWNPRQLLIHSFLNFTLRTK